VPASVRQIRAVLFLVSFCLLLWVVLLLPVLWSPAVTVNFAATRQTIDGFGASATGYTADLSAEQADRFFNPATGLGLSLLRVKAIAGTLDMDCGCVSNHSPYKCEAGSGSQILTGDLHVAELYDPFSIVTLALLDEYRLTGDVPAGTFVRDGHTGPGGTLPTNTGGGQLSGFYLQGMTPLAEAMIQLRGTGGQRQVPGATVALVGGIGGRMDHHAALVLERAA